MIVVTMAACEPDFSLPDADRPHDVDATTGKGTLDSSTRPSIREAGEDSRSARDTSAPDSPSDVFNAPGDAAPGGDGGDGGAPDAAPDAGLLPGRPEVICAMTPAAAPGPSTFILDASVEDTDMFDTASNGDLWPSCWSGDALYAGWGDGYGFDIAEAGAYPRPDIGVAQILGDPSAPDAMSGTSLVHDSVAEQAIFKVWTSGPYYQKPTGMLCLGGNMYLAVQDLNGSDYEDVPAATIAVSSDSGQTWSENKTAPMFSNHQFTTMMFLDYGQDSAAIGSYIYVYGLDYNWRWSLTITPPQGLYLARIPVASNVQDITQWEFFAGQDAEDNPTWTSDFTMRLPVLVDCTRRYVTSTFPGYTVISQGSIVYDAPLNRYLYTSWTDLTYEFYEAPQPWGPWRKFLYKDFGPYPWTAVNSGGYAATVPSKYISPEGGTMWVQSNTWNSGVVHNDFGLRTLQISP